MISAGLLLVCCLLTLARPIWGVALILTLKCSLFNLHQYVTVSLPVGYVEPTEALLTCALARLLWNRRSASLKMYSDEISIYEWFASRTLKSAILPYVLWQALCCIRGALIWQGTEHSRFAIRFFVSGLFTWTLVAVMWMMRRRVREILQMVLVLSGVIAVIHLVIQLFDIRQVMAAAYWASSGEYDFVAQGRERWLQNAEYVRGLPQGVLLMVYSLLYVFARLLTKTRENWPSSYGYAFVALQCLAIGVTFTRSLAVQIVAGCLIVAYLGSVLRLLDPWTLLSRVIIGVFLCALVFGAYAGAKRGFLDYWKERTQQLFNSADYMILSEENEARGKDNIASLNAILDHPILGCGTSRYPSKYSLRDVPATDIHPFLQVGLVGGIPAMMLFLRLQWIIFWRFWQASSPLLEFRRQSLGYFSIIAVTGLVINLCGAGGTISGTGLIAMALFVGLMAAEFADSAEEAMVHLEVPPYEFDHTERRGLITSDDMSRFLRDDLR